MLGKYLMEKKYTLMENKKEYTFKKYTNIIFQEQTSIQSLFNGSILKNCEMNNSDFSKSDFEGTVWINVFVINSFFKSCDIKSSIINSCKFIKCDFSLSVINDTTFRNCIFENCIFTEAIMNQNIFEDCSLINMYLDTATITLSKFENCSIESSILGNCSFYDHIMINCKFRDVTINIDSIGRIYGLTMEQLQKFKYIFIGTTYGFAPDNFFEHIDKIFAGKEWRLQKSVYLFNIKTLNVYDFVISVFKDILFYVEDNIIVKHDELVFVLNILKQLQNENHLPLFALYQGIELLNQAIELLSDIQYYNKTENFNELYNGCFLIFNNLLLKFSQENRNLLSLNSEKKHYILEIHYEGDNVINFDKVLNKFLKYNGYDESYYCKLLKTKKGSIIEVISIILISVFALQLLLYGVNGILLQIADMTTKIQIIKNKRYKKNLLENSIEGKQIQPEIIKNSLDLLKNKEFNKTLSTLASSLDNTKIVSANMTNTTESE